MQQLLNIVRREVERVMARKSSARMGFVTSYDPTNYAVKVALQPEGTETGWIPLMTAWSGNGWGMVCPPFQGAPVDVHFQEGGKGAAYASLRQYSKQTKPPPGCPIGEFWLVHQSGSVIKLTNDGNVTVSANVMVNINAPNITMNPGAGGQVLVNGNLTIAPTYTLTANGINFNTHVHNDAQGGVTGGPHN